MFEKYFKDFLDADMEKNYYYSIKEYSRYNNNYYNVGMKNIEELIYDENGDLKDEGEEYIMLIERFYDYLINNTDAAEKDLVENISNSIYEKVGIYCY